MAIIRNPEDLSNATNYVATIAFFCCISCVTLMLRFGGFKASLNIFNGKKKKESNDVETGLYMTGAYRTNRDEFFGHGRLSDPPRKLTPSMVNLPPCEGNSIAIRSTKSVGDLTKSNSSQQIRQSTQNVSANSHGEDGDKIKRKSCRKSPDKEQKRLDKQRLNEQREREKAAAKEQVKQEKMRDKARKEAEAKTRKDRRKAPQPMKAKALAQSSILQTERPQAHGAYSTNTLESSISRSSGPPPYSERPQTDSEQNQNATTSNITFGKPLDTSSWDMVSEHRQQVSRTTDDGHNKSKKQTIMDLNYNFSNVIKEERDNSEV